LKSATFYDLAKSRRSTRIFAESPVSPDIIRRIVAAATEAPTACNRQLWHCVAVTDPDVKIRMSRYSSAEQSYLYDAPVLLAVFYDCSLENRNPCKTPFIGAGMALYAMLLAAEEEGLGAIYLGGIRNPSGIAKALNAPPFLTNVGVICLGHKADTPPCPPRRPVDGILSYEQCDLKHPHFHADIRPHLWSLRQLADFRDKLVWYKGVHIDGLTLHADPDARFSDKYRYLTGRVGRLCSNYKKPTVLDVLSLNGALALQLLNTCGSDIETLYTYELTPGTLEYMRAYFKTLIRPPENLKELLNEDPDVLRIPLPDHSADVVTCYERLEHFNDPSQILREMYRVLKPGGKLLVTVSNRFYPHLYRYKRMRNREYALGRNWNRGPERKYEPREIETAFRKAGFTVDEMTGLQPVEQKFLSVLEQLCRKFNRHNLADTLSDRNDQMYVTHSLSRYVASTLSYELSKP
jgi:nitroreductase/ubiquinone/menaquinone biosynthesis C-methylase UbiE